MKDIILKFGTYAHGTIQKLGVIKQIDLNNPEFTSEEEKQKWTMWVQSIGGWKNLELRNFLQNFRLA
jgi:hypothetical protein